MIGRVPPRLQRTKAKLESACGGRKTKIGLPEAPTARSFHETQGV